MEQPGAKRRRYGPAFYLAALWVAWFVLTLAFEFLRGFGDEVGTARRVGSIEKALFLGVSPPQFFHDHVFVHDLPWLDYFGFLMHGLWFGVPFASGLVLMIYRRERLMEFFAWFIAASYIAALFYLFLPVEPPWMEEGLPRILYVRNFGDYPEGIDPNPLAAFPSLHATLPMLVSLFFILRGGPRLQFYGCVAGLYAFAVGFSIVYMAEHWVIDVVAGYALAALVAFLFMSRHVAAMVARLPGDPAGRLARLNGRMLPQRPRRPRVVPVEPAAEPAPRAA